MSIKTKFARKAVKTTAKHTAHGAASKLKRNPVRTSTLLALGAAIGAVAGWFAARKTGGSQADFEQTSSPSGSAGPPETKAEPASAAEEPITPQPPTGTTPVPS